MQKYLEETGFKKAKKGHIIHLGDKAIITDPCYRLDTWCQDTITTKPGEYYCFFLESDEGEWGIRIAEIMVIHKEHIDRFMELFNEGDPYSTTIGVDSGSAGIFDYAQYASWKKDDDEAFYNDYSNIILRGENVGTVRKAGYVSSSGYGDGCYPAYAIYDEEKRAVGISIRFIGDDDYDEED